MGAHNLSYAGKPAGREVTRVRVLGIRDWGMDLGLQGLGSRAWGKVVNVSRSVADARD